MPVMMVMMVVIMMVRITTFRSRTAMFFMPVLRRLGLHGNVGDTVPLHGGLHRLGNLVGLGHV